MRHLVYLTIIAVLALTASFYMAQPKACYLQKIKADPPYADKHRLYEINDL